MPCCESKDPCFIGMGSFAAFKRCSTLVFARISRLYTIQKVLLTYGIDQLLLDLKPSLSLKILSSLSPDRWLHKESRNLPRAERLRLSLEQLGPVFVKFGQMLSTRRDLLADDIARELALLQDNVPPFSSEQSKEIIEASLGAPVSELFLSFEPEPLASASIAQVHGAVMLSGESVVIKVLRPDIKKTIERDLSLMYLLADLTSAFWSDGKRMRPREVVSEYEKTIFDELDMQREAANAAQLRRNFKDSKELYIPEVHWDYTQGEVMVMERIKGIPISNIDALNSAGIDLEKLAERGVNIFFTQVFRDNFFHADMHPGNIFVSEEKPLDPSYIAVDFGIVGSLTDEDRHYLSQNLLAFFDQDYYKVARLHVDSGWVPADTSVEDFESSIRTVCEPIFEKPLEEISFGQVLLRLFQTARRFKMEVQPQLVLLQKTLLNIEGLGRQLYPQLDIWQTARPVLKGFMLEQNSPLVVLREIEKNLPEWGRMLPQMPALMHQFIANGAQTRQSISGTQQAPAKTDTTSALIYSILSAGFFICATLITLLSGSGFSVFGVSVWAWLVLVLAIWCLRRAFATVKK